MNIQTLAKNYVGFFITRTRDNGAEFLSVSDNVPRELYDLIHKAHGDMLPDDFKYQFVQIALQTIADNDLEASTLEPSVYTYDRLRWLASNLTRLDYVDTAIEELGSCKTTNDNIALGMSGEMLEVFYIVKDELTKLVK